MAKQASGGARATIARQKKREEAERRAAAMAGESPGPMKIAELGDAPTDPDAAQSWILGSLIKLAVEAKTDPGLTPPQQRREAAEHLARATKAVDAARLRVELDQILERLNSTDDAAQVDSGEDRRVQ